MAALNCTVASVPTRECILVSTDADVKTGKRGEGGGEADSKRLGPYGRDVLNENGKECFNDCGGGRGYDDSIPGEVTQTTPSGDRTTWPPTWSASLPRIQLISPGGWSNKSLGGPIFGLSPPKTGKNLRHPRPPPIVERLKLLLGFAEDNTLSYEHFHLYFQTWYVLHVPKLHPRSSRGVFFVGCGLYFLFQFGQLSQKHPEYTRIEKNTRIAAL